MVKNERVKVMRNITWQKFVNENIGRKIEEVVRGGEILRAVL